MAVSEHAKKLEKFVSEQLAKEVKELRADRTNVQEHVTKLDNFVVEQLAGELKEFHEDKQALVEQKVKMVREGKKQLAESKADSLRKSSTRSKQLSTRLSKRMLHNLKTISQPQEKTILVVEYLSHLQMNPSYLNESPDVKDLEKQIAEVKNNLKKVKQMQKRKQKQLNLLKAS